MRRDTKAIDNQPLSNESITGQLEKILVSESFGRSERLSRFLRYAVEETIRGRKDQLHEYAIGREVFERGDAYDPRIDPIVRVEAARLRNKLDEYYRERGHNDPVIISLSKRGYSPTFGIRRAPARTPFRTRLSRLLIGDWKSLTLVVLALLLVAAVSWIIVLSARNADLRRQSGLAQGLRNVEDYRPVWGRFLSAGAENHVIFGSPMFFASKAADSYLRFPKINDPSDFLTDPYFRMQLKRFGDLSGPRYDYSTVGDTIAVERLATFFAKLGERITVSPAFLTNWNVIKDGNILFLGAPRMNPLLQRLPVRQDFEWGPEPDYNIYNRNPLPGEQKVYVTASHRSAFTYAVIATFPGLYPNRRIILLTAHNTPGTLAAIEQVTRLENVRAIAKTLHLQVAGKETYFQILLRVVPDKDLPVKTELVAYHVSSR
jgi:hypothetical protein